MVHVDKIMCRGSYISGWIQEILKNLFKTILEIHKIRKISLMKNK